MASVKEWAKRYATGLGLPVFPVKPRGKAPLTENGLHDATLDEGQIEEWWTRWPGANVACPIPEGMVVLDVDSHEALQWLSAHEYDIPTTATARTGKGFHFWFQTELPAKNAVGIFEHVDLRGPGGYVVLPPSIHEQGFVYEWEGDKTPAFVSDAPQWLEDAIEGRGDYRVNAPVDVETVLSGISEGARNSEVFRYACRCRKNYKRGHLTEAEAIALVRLAGRQCNPPLPEGEIDGIITHAWRYDGDVVSVLEDGDDFGVIDIDDLMRMDFPPPIWIVPDLIPQGLTAIISSPKLGKSWLTMGLALATFNGGTFLNRICPKGDVLYLDLEQPARKAKQRFLKIPGAWVPGKRGLKLRHKWPTYKEGGFDLIDKYLEQHPECRLVVVDVGQELIGPRPGWGNAYEVDSALYSELKGIADLHNVGIVVVHHEKKDDGMSKADILSTPSGSQGLVAKCDAIVFLKGPRDDPHKRLMFYGRDIEHTVIPVEFDLSTYAWMPVRGMYDFQETGGGPWSPAGFA